jgi:hypothetical protein
MDDPRSGPANAAGAPRALELSVWIEHFEPLIGRIGPVAGPLTPFSGWVALAEALDGIDQGAGTAVLIEGPAGIGKSRLVTEAAALAKARGLRVLRARGESLSTM